MLLVSAFPRSPAETHTSVPQILRRPPSPFGSLWVLPTCSCWCRPSGLFGGLLSPSEVSPSPLRVVSPPSCPSRYPQALFGYTPLPTSLHAPPGASPGPPTLPSPFWGPLEHFPSLPPPPGRVSVTAHPHLHGDNASVFTPPPPPIPQSSLRAPVPALAPCPEPDGHPPAATAMAET